MSSTIVKTRKPSRKAIRAREQLLSQKLSTGQTVRELYESWGFRFEDDTYLSPTGTVVRS
jgi:hypothetical protein